MEFKYILKNKGFTLVEIMIVVAIISTLAVIAIPSFLASRINANEIAAIASCRTINNACQAYYMNRIPHEYPATLLDLVPPATNPPYIDSVLASGSKQGYDFTYALAGSESFTLNANPKTPGRTGRRYFFVDETGVIKANSNGPAGTGDPPVE